MQRMLAYIAAFALALYLVVNAMMPDALDRLVTSVGPNVWLQFAVAIPVAVALMGGVVGSWYASADLAHRLSTRAIIASHGVGLVITYALMAVSFPPTNGLDTLGFVAGTFVFYLLLGISFSVVLGAIYAVCTASAREPAAR